MPYNTSPIPPRTEVTGQTQLPLTRVKKIIAQDSEIQVCSNNAAFVITIAAEMFVQYLTEQAHEKTKLGTKPRRNVQYRDLAAAVAHKDNLEFLEDIIPRTTPYKEVKGKAAAARTKVAGGGNAGKKASAKGGAGGEDRPSDVIIPNGKKQKSIMNGTSKGGSSSSPATNGFARSRILSSDAGDPNEQLQMEMTQHSQEDVDMTG
ncbi:DNA polymerase epsilon subunit C [Podospora fimiseda]|uniref:DNA polymerase epsilon subunit C n=1 Tax=Podospora fimiseda TaxID=252190 RepID=A0AAN7BN48_9PEZI|nr:DNA polymerase epsilon subunit C [Podospora fimiseda]